MSALPQNPTVLGCGAVTVDFLAAVEAYPKPDEKIRSTSLKIQGGGNAGNALTCAARLGLNPRLISKVADDAQGRGILEELEADGIDTSFLVAMWNFASHPPSCTACSLDSTCRVQARDTYPTHHWYPALMPCYTVLGRTQPQKLAHEVRVPSHLYISYYWYSSDVGLHFSATSAMVSKEGNSPFTYVIVDNQTKTRTCIHTPGFPPMIPDYLSKSSLSSALDGVRLVYFDGRLHETALVVGHEAKSRSIPILIDAEKKREGLDDLLNLSDYVVCSAKFPQAWTEASSIPSALLSMLLRLPNVKFVIVTLGGDGCIMLQRSATEGEQSEEIDIDCLLESLNQRKGSSNTAIPTCISSARTKLRANGIGTISGQLFIGTAEKIPPSELLDTTGAGDAFIGAVLYAICAGMQPETMLPFATQVAAASCRALGARTGLPHRTDPRLAPFLQQIS